MKIKRIFSFLLALSVFAGMASAFAASPGSAEDPLVSQSYVDGDYSSTVLNEARESLKNSVAILEYKLNQLSSVSGMSSHMLNAAPGKRITANPGSSFVLLSGSASVHSAAGTLIDLTEGRTLALGGVLSAGHSYAAAENSFIVLNITSTARLSCMGDVNVTSTTISFNDVTKANWFYDDVLYAVDRGIINGRSAEVFDPENNLSVAEAIKLGACMHQLYNTGAITLTNGNPWYMSYVEYAAQNGILSKVYTDYDAKISREEFVNIFYSALPSSEYTVINSIGDDAIPDVKPGDPYYSRIITFYRAGIVTGMSANLEFHPKDNIRRSEVSALVRRMLEKDARKTITIG